MRTCAQIKKESESLRVCARVRVTVGVRAHSRRGGRKGLKGRCASINRPMREREVEKRREGARERVSEQAREGERERQAGRQGERGGGRERGRGQMRKTEREGEKEGKRERGERGIGVG